LKCIEEKIDIQTKINKTRGLTPAIQHYGMLLVEDGQIDKGLSKMKESCDLARINHDPNLDIYEKVYNDYKKICNR